MHKLGTCHEAEHNAKTYTVSWCRKIIPSCSNQCEVQYKSVQFEFKVEYTVGMYELPRDTWSTGTTEKVVKGAK